MKKLIFLVLAIALMVLLVGCASEEDTITIGDKTIKERILIDLDKKAYDDAMKREFSYLDPTYESGVKVVKKNGKEYYESDQTKTFTFNKYMKYSNLDYNSERCYVSKDTFYQKAKVDKADLEMVKESKDIDYSAVKIHVTVTFPKKVVSTNCTINKDNDKQIEYSTNYKKAVSEGYTIFGTTNKNVTPKKLNALLKKWCYIGKTKIKKIKRVKRKNKSGDGSVIVKYKKVKKAKKYKVEWCLSKKFDASSSYKAFSKKTKKTKLKVKKLARNKKYYFRVYAMRKNHFGSWVESAASKVKSIKVK